MNRDLIESLNNNSSLVDEEIKRLYSFFNDPDTDGLRKAELYSLTAGGKRIRSFLVNEFCRVCGGSLKASLPFSAAVEMIHTFSLIHDDLPCMDNDDLRRGKPTSHIVFGEATALLAGDSLAIRAFHTIAQNNYVNDITISEAVVALSEAVFSEGMIGGQIIDMRGECEAIDFDTLLKLHSKKTGSLIEASAKLGCLAAGIRCDDARFISATKYALNIGLAFQIIDDILDVTADASLLGKNTGVDASRNKTTFLSFMSIDEAREYAEKLTTEAKQALECFDNNEILIQLADYLLTREL